jgi:UDP-sugar pyrophosphorylase
VEYNQLDALMKSAGKKDTCDKSGFSPYPGNINVLIFDAQQYAAELEKSKGIISEFVNPKYADSEKTTFKSPTRLECMMQDYPKLLGSEVPVGCTQFERWNCFSAVKNNVQDAVAKQASTGFGECGASGEADIYWANRNVLKKAGCTIDLDGKEATYEGIKVKEGAHVVLAPSFACTMAEANSKINGAGVSVSDKSTLVLGGAGITLTGLELDGALIVNCAPGAKVEVKDSKVCNKGFSFVPIDDKTGVAEQYLIRGYTLATDEEITVNVLSGSETLVLDGVAPGNYNLKDGKLVVAPKESRPTCQCTVQ